MTDLWHVRVSARIRLYKLARFSALVSHKTDSTVDSG